MTDEQKLYFGTKTQRAAMVKKHPSWRNGRKSASNNQSTKKTASRKTASRKTASRNTASRKTTVKKTTAKKSNKTVTTEQAVAIGAGGVIVGAAGGFVAGTILADQTKSLLNKMSNSGNSVVAKVGDLLGGNKTIPAASTQMLPVDVHVTAPENLIPIMNTWDWSIPDLTDKQTTVKLTDTGYINELNNAYADILG